MKKSGRTYEVETEILEVEHLDQALARMKNSSVTALRFEILLQ